MIFALGHTAELVIIHLDVAHLDALGFIGPSELYDTVVGITVGIGQRIHLAVGENAGTVKDAQRLQSGDLGRQVFLADVLGGIGVPGDVGHKNCQNNNHQNNRSRDHGHLAVTQADHGVLEEAHRLRLEFLVLDLFLLDGLELGIGDVQELLGEIIFVDKHHLLPPPTLTRGSIMP